MSDRLEELEMALFQMARYPGVRRYVGTDVHDRALNALSPSLRKQAELDEVGIPNTPTDTREAE